MVWAQSSKKCFTYAIFEDIYNILKLTGMGNDQTEKMPSGIQNDHPRTCQPDVTQL